MIGQLFTQYFLTEGIQATDAWQDCVRQARTFTAFKQSLSEILDKIASSHEPNEAQTENEVVRPLLELLGWDHHMPQQGSDRQEDIPDYLLFADGESKDRAAARKGSENRFQDALVIEESKRFGLPLDNRDSGETARRGTPHGQILRYLDTADSVTDGRIRWGILTNGAVWRLYDFRARPRASGFYEADLKALLQQDDDHALRAIFLLFRRESFIAQEGAATTFLEDAIAEGKRYEQRVAADLSDVVFARVFPNLVEALADRYAVAGDPSGDLTAVRHAALIFLYRLLFILYAEDRGLLPVNDRRYDDYGLRKRVRDDVANRMQIGDTFSSAATNYYDRLNTLFKLIDRGDPSIGLPPYNGGLFSRDSAPLLESVRLPDSVIADIIYDLSHTRSARKGDGVRSFVNYRDMSVQQLGSIYERLLEQEPVRGDDGNIGMRPNPYARKDSGSFYTPQELVDLIVEKTLEPLVEERLTAFETRAEELRSDHRPKLERRKELEALDPAVAALDLKILDPAMGSGHFLVTAVDYLSDYIAHMVEYVPAVPEWLDDGCGSAYVSPLVERIAAIREEILQRARESDWAIDKLQLTDQAIIRRMVLKRCIYGVDKNPLAVELAKVSLWLHSFTVGAPLSFLDHHLRCGDSLLGLRVTEGIEDLRRLGGLFTFNVMQGAENATNAMQDIERLSDADITEVEKSSMLFRSVEQTTAGLRSVLDILCGLRWLTAGLKKNDIKALEIPLVEALDANRESAFSLIAQGSNGSGFLVQEFKELWRKARAIADRENFLHWEAAFPGVWEKWQDAHPRGGFDAVIGNPPWDRIKLQEVEWFATRAPELARAPTAAARRAAIGELRTQSDPLAADFDDAKARADSLGRLVRASGHYPLLGGGDINLYSLFVERAMRLVKAEGLVGLLTPSGIYADKTAAKFFKSVSTRGRVAGLYDFENRRLGTDLPPFFPDVDSRFKFCALIVGGTERRFDATTCAFFLHDAKTIADADRCFPLAPDDFARVNPNTGTAPVFRTRRDADITRDIYARHPVLVNRSDGKEHKTWPVKYVRMFDMANDSHLFRTAAELDDAGFYPVQGNRWKRGEEVYQPLYEGKMVQAFDHRAASIVTRSGNLFRPGQPDRTLDEERLNAAFSPRPRYWVSKQESDVALGVNYLLAFKDITASTNVRTMIAATIPQVGCGHTLPILIPAKEDFDAGSAACLLANFNSFAFDYVARQKVQGTHLTWYTVEQLPVIAPEDYDRQFGEKTAHDLVRDHVLRLTYTAHDMAPFARDLGHVGPPFIWNEEERRHLRARLDALYFHLYGISREDADYILDTFPIVRRQDEAAFNHYRTRDLILAYMNALTAGDTETVIAV